MTARLVEVFELLQRHPLLGRPVEQGLRELVISRGKTGSLALYRWRKREEGVLVLAIRHQHRRVTGSRSSSLEPPGAGVFSLASAPAL